MKLAKYSRLIGLLLAWVMWSKTTSLFPVDPTYPHWEFHEAFSTQAQCRSKVHDSLVVVKKPPKEFPELKGVFRNVDDRGFQILFPDGALHQVTYLCVPDTIDPRPKG